MLQKSIITTTGELIKKADTGKRTRESSCKSTAIREKEKTVVKGTPGEFSITETSSVQETAMHETLSRRHC